MDRGRFVVADETAHVVRVYEVGPEGTWDEVDAVGLPEELTPAAFPQGVAVLGDLLVAGDHVYPDPTERGGAAFLWERVDGDWVFRQRLQEVGFPTPYEGYYGRGVALWHGEAIVVNERFPALRQFRRADGWDEGWWDRDDRAGWEVEVWGDHLVGLRLDRGVADDETDTERRRDRRRLWRRHVRTLYRRRIVRGGPGLFPRVPVRARPVPALRRRFAPHSAGAAAGRGRGAELFRVRRGLLSWRRSRRTTSQRPMSNRCSLLCVLVALAITPAAAHAGDGARAAANVLLQLAGSSQEVLLPSDIDRRLRDLDEDNPFAELGISYPVTGVRVYDRFFEDLARVHGTIALAEYMVESSNTLIDDTLVDEVFSGDIFVDSFGRVIDVPAEDRQAMLVALVRGDSREAGRIVRGFSSIQFRQVRENFVEAYGSVGRVIEFAPIIADELADLPDAIVDLGEQAPDLVTEAPTAFAGADVVHAPRVAAALSQAAVDLAELPGRVAEIANGVAAIGSTRR